jgi:DNA-binding MarR family transcriptional regulator
MRRNPKAAAHKGQLELAEEIVGRLVRRHTTAAVLFHHAVAERLGLGPTDLQCLSLLRERGAMPGSELAAITGLTSGAITGVVARLERAGYLRREPDPRDGRKQVLSPALERVQAIHDVFGPIRKDMAALLEGFDPHQLNAIADFLTRSTDCVYRHMGLLRAQALYTSSQTRGTTQATTADSAGEGPEMKGPRPPVQARSKKKK